MCVLCMLYACSMPAIHMLNVCSMHALCMLYACPMHALCKLYVFSMHSLYLFYFCLFDRDNAQYIIEPDYSHKANLHVIYTYSLFIISCFFVVKLWYIMGDIHGNLNQSEGVFVLKWSNMLENTNECSWARLMRCVFVERRLPRSGQERWV